MSDFGSFTKSIDRRDSIVGAGGGCSYNGVCCVLPALHDYDCSTCGLWGDGVRHKVMPPKPSTPNSYSSTTTTTNTPLIKKITERIVGGQDAPRDRWCWQVAILDKNGLIGSGALIARNWVLTAAHLVAGRFLDELMIALNLHDFVHINSSRNVWYSNPIGAVIEESYNPATWSNNIALLRIPDAPCSERGICTICLPTNPITFQRVTPPPTITSTTTSTTTTPTITPTTPYSYGAAYFNPLQTVFDPKQALQAIQKQMEAQVPTSPGGGGTATTITDAPNPYKKLVCEVTGWGMTGSRPVAPVLQEAFQQIIRPNDCEETFARLNVPEEKISIPDGAFCVQDPNRLASTCVGDGGSPLACQSPIDNSWVLRGLVILGTNMCMTGADNGPTIVVNVGEFIEWIRDTVQTPLPAPDANSGPYKVPACGENYFNTNKNADTSGGCPERIHADGVAARNVIVTGGLPFN